MEKRQTMLQHIVLVSILKNIFQILAISMDRMIDMGLPQVFSILQKLY